MSKTVNSRMHRIRHRGRLEDPRNHQRKLNAHADEAATQMNNIGGVSGVTPTEVIASIRNNLSTTPAGPRDIRAEYQRGVTTVAEVEALGIPIA